MEKSNQTRSRASRREIDAFRHLIMSKARNKRIVIIAVSLCLILCLVACAATGIFLWSQRDTDDGRILQNVIVGGINIGGMTPEDAESMLRLSIGSALATQNMVVHAQDRSLVLSPQDTGVSLDVDDLVEAAYNYGRTGSSTENYRAKKNAETKTHTIALLEYLDLDHNYIQKAVTEFCQNNSVSLSQTSVTINGTRPTYTGLEPGDPEYVPIVHQTLTITLGVPESILDPTELYYEILDAYSLFQMDIDFEGDVMTEPDAPDAAAIFKQFCLLPQDATIDNKTFAVTEEVYGYGFDVASLQRKLDRADYGETITVTLDFLMPDITAEALAGDLFKDVLASYTSVYTDVYNANRNTNLKISCEAINGYVIKVGESFDFNQILGPRTKNKGYASAPTYSGSTSSTIGGGISQTSSVLYYCALLSGLQIDERHSHDYAVQYTPMGTDAMINYGGENLVFTNNTTAPIRILAEANDSSVTITFLGTDTREYLLAIEYQVLSSSTPVTTFQPMEKDNAMGYVNGQVIQSGLTGYSIQTYLCKYSTQTGGLVGKEKLTLDHYERRDQIIIQIVENTDSDYSGI